eukprot:14998236-Ditylum_brightwellii.AAC.1
MEDTKECWEKVANKDNKNDKQVIRLFAEGFNPGPQRGEKGWIAVDNNKRKNCKDKKNQGKEQKMGGEKCKNDIINENTMEEEEGGKTESVKVFKMEEDEKENNKARDEKNKEEGTRNNKEMKETKSVVINARDEEEDNPVP